MDASKFAGSGFIDLSDVKDARFRGEVAGVQQGNYDKLVLVFTNGLRFSLNVTNITEMIKAFGSETDDWIGERVELYAGEAPYQKKMVPSVRLTPLMREAGEKKPPKPKAAPGKSGDMDDTIPFS
jgi:hypothetical protein